MVPLLQDYGVGMIPWSPLARQAQNDLDPDLFSRRLTHEWQGFSNTTSERADTSRPRRSVRIFEVSKAENGR